MDASRSPPETGTIVVALRGPVALAEVRWLCERVRFLLEGRGTTRLVCDVRGVEDPDAGTVDVLARMQLTAQRHGGTLELRGAGRQLRELLGLTGLSEVLRCR